MVSPLAESHPQLLLDVISEQFCGPDDQGGHRLPPLAGSHPHLLPDSVLGVVSEQLQEEGDDLLPVHPELLPCHPHDHGYLCSDQVQQQEGFTAETLPDVKPSPLPGPTGLVEASILNHKDVPCTFSPHPLLTLLSFITISSNTHQFFGFWAFVHLISNEIRFPKLKLCLF